MWPRLPSLPQLWKGQDAPAPAPQSLQEAWALARQRAQRAFSNIRQPTYTDDNHRTVGGDMRRLFAEADVAFSAVLSEGECHLNRVRKAIETRTAAPTHAAAASGDAAHGDSQLSVRRAEARAALQRAAGLAELDFNRWDEEHAVMQKQLLQLWDAREVPEDARGNFRDCAEMRKALTALVECCGSTIKQAEQDQQAKLISVCVPGVVGEDVDTSLDPRAARIAIERSSSFSIMHIATVVKQLESIDVPSTLLADVVLLLKVRLSDERGIILPLSWNELVTQLVRVSTRVLIIPRPLTLPSEDLTIVELDRLVHVAHSKTAEARAASLTTAPFRCHGCAMHGLINHDRVTIAQFEATMVVLHQHADAVKAYTAAIEAAFNIYARNVNLHVSSEECARLKLEAQHCEELRALDSIIAACSQVCFVSTRYIGCSPAFWTREEYVANTKTFFACLDEVLEGSIRTECGLYDVAQSSGKSTQDVHERLSSSLSTLLKDTRDAVGATLAAKAGNLIEAFRPAMSADACMLLASSPCFDVFSRSVSEITFPAQYEWGRLAASLLEEWMKTLPSVLLCAPAEFKLFETDPAMARRMHDVVTLACQLTAWSAIANSDVDLIPAQSSQGLLYDPALHKAWDADSRTRVTKGEIVIALGLLPACRSPSKETSGSVTPTVAAQLCSPVVVGAPDQFPGLRIICLTRWCTAAAVAGPPGTTAFSDELARRPANVSATGADPVRVQRRRAAAAAVADVAASMTASPRATCLAPEWESNFSMATWLLAGDVGVSATAHRLRKTREEAASASAEVASSHTRAAVSAETVATTVVSPFQQSDMGFAGLLSFGAPPSQAEPPVDMPRAPSVPSSRSAITAAREAADAAAISARNAQAETRGHSQW